MFKELMNLDTLSRNIISPPSAYHSLRRCMTQESRLKVTVVGRCVWLGLSGSGCYR
jgi:hypothetical protein